MRRLGAIAAVVLAFGAAACDDNPLSEGRTDAANLTLSHTNAVIQAGDTITIVATVRNPYGAPTGASVTAQACDNKVTAAPDPSRSQFEYPERFRVAGVAFGTSCVVINGGGLTDTVDIRVVPARIALSRRDSLGSGEAAQLAVQFLTRAGTPGTGLTVANVTFASADTNRVAVTAQGEIQGRAPGTTVVRVTYSQLGVTRRDSIAVTVVPGVFAGTVARSSTGAGAAQVLTFTQGAIPFDSDTRVQLSLGGYTTPTWFGLPVGAANQRRIVLPFGLPANTTITYDVVNLGPNQVASRGTFTVNPAVPANDPLEPDESFGTPKSMVPGDAFFGTLSGTDGEDVIKLTITEAGTYTVLFQWDEPSGDGAAGSDLDMYVLNSQGQTLLARETFSAPQETGNITLQPGTYYIDLAVWAFVGRPGQSTTTYRVSVTKQ